MQILTPPQVLPTLFPTAHTHTPNHTTLGTLRTTRSTSSSQTTPQHISTAEISNHMHASHPLHTLLTTALSHTLRRTMPCTRPPAVPSIAGQHKTIPPLPAEYPSDRPTPGSLHVCLTLWPYKNTNVMHLILFIRQIFSSTCFEYQVLIFWRIQLYVSSIWYRHSL